jgi:UDP-N-acetylenolpyruvoylglucosamine reductase
MSEVKDAVIEQINNSDEEKELNLYANLNIDTGDIYSIAFGIGSNLLITEEGIDIVLSQIKKVFMESRKNYVDPDGKAVESKYRS